MTHKCIYCGKKIEPRNKYTIKFDTKKHHDTKYEGKVHACCDECYEASLGYFAFYSRYKNAFAIVCTLALVGTLVCSFLLKDALLTAICMFILAFTVALLPLGTPNSIALYGIKKMKLLARVGGLLFMLCGIMTILAGK